MAKKRSLNFLMQIFLHYKICFRVCAFSVLIIHAILTIFFVGFHWDSPCINKLMSAVFTLSRRKISLKSQKLFFLCFRTVSIWPGTVIENLKGRPKRSVASIFLDLFDIEVGV